METIDINERVAIPLSELDLSYARSGGPGGQNVNKVETKVVLRFDVAGSRSLDEDDRQRALRRLHNRITKEGELVIQCDTTRERERNRAEAIERFRTLMRTALAHPRRRRPTKPSRAARQRRLSEKRRRGELKRQRAKPGAD